MDAEQHKNTLTAETGRLGGLKRAERQSPEERRASARHAAWSRWHPQEAQAAKEKAREITHLIKQALRDDK